MDRRGGRRLWAGLLVALAWGGTAAGAAPLYRWVDAAGQVHFGDSPPPTAAADPLRVAPNTVATVPVPPATADSETAPTAGSRAVVIYTAEWCAVCRKAKSYFREHAIPFTEYDIETSRKGKADYKRLGGQGVPLILVGKQRMSGFSPGGFERLYR